MTATGRPGNRVGRWWMVAVLLVLVLSTGCQPGRPAVGRTPEPAGGAAAADPPPIATAGTKPGPGPLVTPPPAPEPRAPELVEYTGQVAHFFVHPLIAYPELAFDGDDMAQGYNDWMITVPEFRKILDALYQGDYILVDLGSLFDIKTTDGKTTVTQRTLRLPKGKKPLVLSVDDVNYYEYMRQNGNVYKLVLDDQGRVATFSRTPKGEPVTAYDNDVVPLLDSFVAAHPDFSWQGAKGVLALTGYEGILGYRTNDPESPAYAQEKEQALAVVHRLKATGWTFASHGWGHQPAAQISYAHLQRDTERWKAEVEPLTGPTPIYVYPHGSAVLPGDPKFQFLQESGFHIFCGVGPTPDLQVKAGYVMLDRRHVDGMALQTQRDLLLDLFDARDVLDPVRPPSKH